MTHEESVIATRQWFVDNARGCIDDVERYLATNGAEGHRVNNPEGYIEWRRETISQMLAGERDHTFAFQQRRHFIQTGECIPLFSRS